MCVWSNKININIIKFINLFVSLFFGFFVRFIVSLFCFCLICLCWLFWFFDFLSVWVCRLLVYWSVCCVFVYIYVNSYLYFCVVWCVACCGCVWMVGMCESVDNLGIMWVCRRVLVLVSLNNIWMLKTF